MKNTNALSRPAPRRAPLAMAIAVALTATAGAAWAQDDQDDVIELEEIIVTATPIGRAADELSQSATVLAGEELARESRNNLGDTLLRLPGLYSASFGENIGRPVIRGQQGVRVGVLTDGMATFDASAASQDHAVPTEPFLADRIEVLRGPNTLLYGSYAIGGVVNVVTDIIPTEAPADGFDGRILLQGDTAADQRLGAARIDFGVGDFAFHANGFYRRTDDYEIPGAAELFPDDDHDDHGEDHEDHDDHEDHGEEEITGVLENSFLDNEGGSFGGAWLGESWRIGLAWTGYNSDYGIPGGHSHGHGDEHDHGDEDHDHDEEEHGEEEEENVTIGLESNRVDALIAADQPFNGIADLELKMAVTDYTHTEFEGAEIGTRFDSETTDLRFELGHEPIGAWSGTIGVQWSDNDFSAAGEEAFVPPSTTQTGGLFLVETAEFGDVQLDFGIRYEDTTIDSFLVSHDDDHGDEDHDHDEDHDDHGDEMMTAASRDFQPLSLSFGAVWHVTEGSHLAFNIATAERAPNAVELFSNGPHAATQTFEIGDPDLRVETNRHLEVSYRLHQGPVTGSITLYHDDFDDHVYERDTGMMEDGLPVRVWSQQDAEFTGGELEVRWDLGQFDSGRWQLFGFYDRVRATLADGSAVPRIPPQRLGLGFDWDLGPLAANLTWINADDQDRTAEFETETPGYDLLNAEASWYIANGSDMDFEIFLQGRNLLDEDIRISTSFLKDDAPQIGRNFVFGVRSTF